MGFKVEVKTFGPVTCSSTFPPSKLSQYGFNTNCFIFKNGQVVAVEVTSKIEQEMIATDKLHHSRRRWLDVWDSECLTVETPVGVKHVLLRSVGGMRLEFPPENRMINRKNYIGRLFQIK
jgi:hypothetical protein